MPNEKREVTFLVPGDKIPQLVEFIAKEFGLAPSHAILNYSNKSIFINYRRDDSEEICGRIWDRLIQAFGKESVFRDVQSILLGSNWKKRLEQEIARCDVMLVLIGKNWNNDLNKRKLHEKSDYVRYEIETALKREIPVVPIWVGRRWMMENMTSDLSDLPDSLQELLERQGHSIHPDPAFDDDMRNLIAHIKEIFDIQDELKTLNRMQ